MGAGCLPSGVTTFLFTDIEGSTRLLQDLGDDAYEASLAEHRRLLREAFATHDGIEVGTEGDSFFAAFADPGLALRAALTAQLAIEGWDWPRRPLRVRMGLHTGEAKLVGREYVGLAVHEAARISSAAHGGQILLSDTTYEIVSRSLPTDARLVDLGEHRLKDLTEAVRLFNVVHPRLAAEARPPRTLTVLPNNLPVQLSTFIGRADEIGQISSLVDTARLLTLAGAGGCGKTRLALQVAAERSTTFPDGVWFAELASLTDGELVLRAVAEAFGLQAKPEGSIEDVLLDFVCERRLLIVLDNCEHLVAASADACSKLLSAARELRILATSREPLGVPGEQVYRVPSLDVGHHDGNLDSIVACDAVRLFSNRAVAADPTFTVDAANISVIADICRRLDGLPLAIELAAARVRMFTPTEIASRLDQRFAILTGGARTGLRRQQTLRAAVDWSYELLSDPEQLLFRRLSVFVGGFALEAAEAICSGNGIETDEIVDLVSSLVDRSIVVAEPHDGTMRYRLLETIREYSRELLASSDEAARVWSRHLRWFADLAAKGSDGLETSDELRWAKHLDAEVDNFRQALAWSVAGGEAVDGVRLVAAIAPYWTNHGKVADAHTWLNSTIAAAGELALPVRAMALAAFAMTSMHAEGFEAGIPYAEECVSLPHTPETVRWIADATAALAYAPGSVEQSLAQLDEARRLYHSIGRAFGEAEALEAMAQALTWSGDFDHVRRVTEEALEIYERLGVRTKVIGAMDMLAVVALQEGDLADVERRAGEVLALAREINDRPHVAYALWDLAIVESERGHYDRARALYDQIMPMLRDLHAVQLIAECFRYMSLIDVRCGDADAAAAALDEAEDTWTYSGRQRADLDILRSRIELVRGDAGAMRALAEQALAVFEKAEASAAIPGAQTYLAWAAALTGDEEHARTLAHAAMEGARQPVRKMGALQIAARIDFVSGALDKATARLVEALEAASRKGYGYETAYMLEMLGWVAAAEGHVERAVHLLGAADEMRSTHGFALLVVDRSLHDDAIAASKDALGDEAFLRSWNEAHAMTKDEAVALALQT